MKERRSYLTVSFIEKMLADLDKSDAAMRETIVRFEQEISDNIPAPKRTAVTDRRARHIWVAIL